MDFYYTYLKLNICECIRSTSVNLSYMQIFLNIFVQQ